MRVFDAGFGEQFGDEGRLSGSGILNDDPVKVLDLDESLSEASQFRLLHVTSVSRSDRVNPRKLRDLGKHKSKCISIKLRLAYLSN